MGIFTVGRRSIRKREMASGNQNEESKLAWVKLWDSIEDHDKKSVWQQGELCEWGPNNGMCLLSWILPCVSLTNLMRKAGITNSHCEDICCCISGVLPCFLNGAVGRVRTKIRKDYGLSGNVARDCIVGVCCPCCGLIQAHSQMTYEKKGKDLISKQPMSLLRPHSS